MNRSLSVLLPVHNAQASLGSLVDELVDVLPELTPDFEVLIVDDGSTDDTADVAQHLVARFPQLALLRNDMRLGGEAALEVALKAARGDVIFLREEGTDLDIRDIGKLWARMSRRQLVFARPLATSSRLGHDESSSTAMSHWEQAALDAIRPASATRAAAAPGFKMLLRSVAQESSWWISRSTSSITDLTDRGYSCEEIALRTPWGVSSEQPADHAPMPHRSLQPAGSRRRPNYLARILAITSGN